MTLKKDIIGAEVQIGSNEAQKSLTDLSQKTAALANENDRLRISQAKLKALGKESTEEYKKISAAISSNSKQIKDNNAQMDALRKTLGVTEMSTKQLAKRAQELRRELSGMNQASDPARFNKLNQELVETERQMRKNKAAIGETRQAINPLVAGAKSLLPAFGWASIAAGAKMAFDKIVASTDTLSTKWAVFMGGMREASNEFFRTLATGNWDNFVTNMRNAIEVGREYERMLDDIEAKQRALSIAESDAKEEIVKLEEDLRNQGLTDEQRLAAGKRRIEIEEELAKNRAKVAKQEYENEVMMAKQASKLSDEKLQQLIRDLDSEKKIKAEAYNALQDELKKQEAKAAQGGASTGIFYPGMTSSSGNAAVIENIKKQMAGFSPDVVTYAGDLRLLGNVTDEQLNKMVAAYGKFKDAEVSGRESIKRVITMVNSLQAEEKKGGETGGSKTKKPGLKTDFSDIQTEIESNTRIQDLKEQYDIEAMMEAERLAAKKASEEEFTNFLEKQIEDRAAAEAKALGIEKEIAEARIALKDIQVAAVGELASSLAGMFEQGSAAQIAMIAVEKAIAIAQIWMNLAKEKSAINLAAAEMSTIPVVGPGLAATYSATMTAKAIAAAKINTGLVLAQTVASAVSSKKREKKQAYAAGKYPGLQTGMYGDKPHYALFNEVPGEPEMVVDGKTTRRLQFNYPEIIKAIYAVRDGRQPAYADGKYPVSYNPQPGTGNPEPVFPSMDRETAANLTTAINNLMKWKPKLIYEMIQKGLDDLNEIEQKR